MRKIAATATKAPMPAAFAHFGFVSFQTKNKIKPTMGMQQPKIPQPRSPVSCTSESVDVGTPQ